jgi:alpha-beta hydrolase superfamily lysophospholipase
MRHYEDSFQGIGGIELYYQFWVPDGEPKAVLIIIHGLGEHGGRYPHVIERLVPHGYAVYTMDLRGHGRSSEQRGYINSYGEIRSDVKTFIEIVQKKEAGKPLFLMGHSLGGLIVLDYVLFYPDGLKGIIASAPSLMQTGISPVLMLIARILSRLAPRFSLETGLDASALSRDPAVVEAYRSDPLVHSKGTPRMGAEVQTAMSWANAHLSEIKLPLLTIQGEADRLIPLEASHILYEQAASPDKQRITYPGGYHEPHNDINHDQAVADLEAWLEKHR